MNAIITQPVSEMFMLGTTATPAVNADEAAGWKTEAQRLALGAKQRGGEVRQ